MKISVTRNDIVNTEIERTQRNPFSCPIARAVNRQLKKGFVAYVGLSTIEIRPAVDTTKKVSEETLPTKAKDFVFDTVHGKRTELLEFELKWIDQYFKEVNELKQKELF